MKLEINNKSGNNNRRNFIKKTGVSLGSMMFIPSHVLFTKKEVRDAAGQITQKAVVAPSDKVNLACCGIGNRGGAIIRDLYATGAANVVALCDVNLHGEKSQKSLGVHSNATHFNDFRKMFEEMEGKIDAVSVGTPDFSHFPITILAMSLGKHVYVEKPLTRTFRESELLIKAAKKYGVATQMGNQGHCQDNYYQFKSWVENGVIKDVTKITAHMNGKRRWHGWDTNMKTFPKGQKLPKSFDWDTWLMAYPNHDFHPDLIDGQWRCWYEYGNGALGDWGAHVMDGFHQFLDLGLPSKIKPIGLTGHNNLFYPTSSTLEFDFPKRGEMPEVKVTWFDGTDNIPQVPKNYGDVEIDKTAKTKKGMVQPKGLRAGKVIYGKDLTFKGGSHHRTLSVIPTENGKDIKKNDLPEYFKSDTNHFMNFMNASRGMEKCLSPFEVSAPLSQLFCLGTIAQQVNETLEFDRETKTITNNTNANNLLKGPAPRKGWEEFYNLV